jgi:hypothetical protein
MHRFLVDAEDRQTYLDLLEEAHTSPRQVLSRPSSG